MHILSVETSQQVWRNSVEGSSLHEREGRTTDGGDDGLDCHDTDMLEDAYIVQCGGGSLPEQLPTVWASQCFIEAAWKEGLAYRRGNADWGHHADGCRGVLQ